MTAPHTTPTPGWLVAVLGALLLPLAGGAFVLSFEQQLPVMMLGGWGPRTAPLGPVVLDLAASAGAVMHVVARDRQVRAWGLGLLVGATGLSVVVNLAGHSIAVPGGTTRAVMPDSMAGWHLPGRWDLVVMLLSVAVPIMVGVLVHAFGAVLRAWLDSRSGRVGSGTRLAVGPVGYPTGRLSDYPTHVEPADSAKPTRPDPVADSPADSPVPPDPTGRVGYPTRVAESGTRLEPDSGPDLRESGESGSRPDPARPVESGKPTLPTAREPDPTRQADCPTDRPDPVADSPDPTGEPEADPTPATRLADPTQKQSTEPDPTRPDSDADPTDPTLDGQLDAARRLIESGRLQPGARGSYTEQAVREALSVGAARAREIREALNADLRHGLRAVV